jgi:hypothetical protein
VLETNENRRLAARLAPMAPQGDLAPRDCLRCHRGHGFRAPAPSAAERETIENIVALLARSLDALRKRIPRVRGCNPNAGPAESIAVVRDRIAIVDGAGRPLGDCNADDRFEAREDPMVSDAIASDLYARAYDWLTVERDRTRGLHNPARATELLERIE